MGKLNLNLVAMLVPLLIVAIGLIGWVTTLRGDVNAAQAQVIEVRADIKPLQDETKQYAIDIQNLHELIKDIDKIEEVVDRVDVALFRIDSIDEAVKANIPAIVALEKSLAIANDQMKNIMSDHEYMGEMLEELGEKQPSGERRSYGGY